MNVLILTPDRVGSTLLQRLITIYMNGHEYDKPVINLHELTNGIESYYSDVYNQEILGKPKKGENWGYYQSLEEIVNKLSNADHYKTARLALYHLNVRDDSTKDRTQFYNYLNDNFYIISARRNNLFEHGISWGIVTASKKLNVYTHAEKVDTFYNIYKNGITIDKTTLTNYLYSYKNYLEWSDKHFRVASYFDYEKDLKDIEKYILNLDIFPNNEKKTWNDIFDIEWSDWNKCHKLISDVGSMDTKLLEHDGVQTPNTALVLSKLKNNLSLLDQDYLLEHSTKYVAAYKGIDQLVRNGALVTGVPIKLQTMAEKKKVIKNFDECVEVYNKWVDENNLGIKYTNDELKQIANEEVKSWYNEVPKNLLLE
jgi:hypothetical protein